MKYTLLDLTQQVLSSIDGDEINSIGDTVEAQQVVSIIRRCYTNLAPKLNYPEKKTLFGLTPSVDPGKPTIMYLPATALSVEWVKYDCKKLGETDTDFQTMDYVPLDEFFKRMHSLLPSADTSLEAFTVMVNTQPVQFVVRTDLAPSYYTTWDDQTFVFNSYDASVDTTLQTSKTLCFGEAQLTWTATDTFIIPFDDHQLLLNEAIALAWAEMKQAQNIKAEREARNQLVATSREKTAITAYDNYKIKTPDFGRKR